MSKAQPLDTKLAILGCLFGACCWGIIWYPYRILAESGLAGIASSIYTYIVAVSIGCVLFAKHWRAIKDIPKSIIWLCLVAGWTNLSYVVAVIDGEVMRVMLLFYLSPIWTLILAHFWLHEKTTKTGYIAITISLMGAYIMLTNPLSGTLSLPIPQSKSDWLALSAGMGFALTNVITRKASYLSLHAKSFAVWIGVIAMVLLWLPFIHTSLPAPQLITLKQWLIIVLIALLIMAATYFVQYGVTKITATRASVLFLFELIVAAVASYYLTSEVMTLSEWIGGALILSAAVFAALNHPNEH